MANDKLKYRLEDNTRFARFEEGKLVKYRAGTAMDTVELSPEEAAKFAPGRLTPLTSVADAKKLVESTSDNEALRDIKHAEESSAHPRASVVKAVENKLNKPNTTA